MRNTTISIDEQTLEESRKYARKLGYSFSAWVNKLIRDAITKAPKRRMDQLMELSDKVAGDSKGKPWTKDEIYDR